MRPLVFYFKKKTKEKFFLCIKNTASSSEISDAQYKQILHLIQAGFKELNASSTSFVMSSTWISANTVHAAGTIKFFVFHRFQNLPLESKVDSWFWYNGSHYFISWLLTNITIINFVLHLPNDNEAKVTHIGTMILHQDITLDKILCVSHSIIICCQFQD